MAPAAAPPSVYVAAPAQEVLVAEGAVAAQRKIVGEPDILKVREAIVGETLDEMLTRAPAAKAEIDALAEIIATEFGGNVVKTPIKGRRRALEKILIDYAGDASRIKDLARNTIVIEAERIPGVLSRLETLGARIKVIKRSDNPLGYSGINATLLTGSRLTAEIQISTPQMIFARTRPEKARAILGNELYEKIAGDVGVPGGRGHDLYEEWRALAPDSSRATVIALESREYYAKFQ